MPTADDDAEQSDVGVRPLAASRLGVPPPACGERSGRMPTGHDDAERSDEEERS